MSPCGGSSPCNHHCARTACKAGSRTRHTANISAAHRAVPCCQSSSAGSRLTWYQEYAYRDCNVSRTQEFTVTICFAGQSIRCLCPMLLPAQRALLMPSALTSSTFGPHQRFIARESGHRLGHPAPLASINSPDERVITSLTHDGLTCKKKRVLAARCRD